MVATDAFECTARSCSLNFHPRMPSVISLAFQGPLLPGTAIGALAVVPICVRGRPAARAAHSGRAGREPAARGRRADTVVDHTEDVMTGLRFGIVSESVLQGRAWL